MFVQALRTGRREEPLIAVSASMRRVLEVAERAAGSDATVLLTGESGTGKERLARFLHERSRRRRGPFVAVNCGALPETLLESELFGHARGAFTGAIAEKKGLLEAAEAGTLFLDEIGETSPAMQVKLLRALQDRCVRPVGATRERAIDVRVIAATNRDLDALVRAGSFRRDLFFRLRVVALDVPPLRERVEDVRPLAEAALERACTAHGRRVVLSPSAVERLEAYAWPGNVRELENAIERAVLLASGPTLRDDDLPADVRAGVSVLDDGAVLTLEEVERRHILATLERFRSNRKETAAALGIGENTLWRKLKRWGLVRDRRPAMARRTNVEHPPTRLVGRREDLEKLASLLAARRLVTITGTGGVGKTRLAVEHARASLDRRASEEWHAREAEGRPSDRYPGGVWMCALSEARDLDEMSLAVARALGLALSGTIAAVQVAGALAERGRALLVLDELESLLPVARDAIGRWLEAAPELSILTTSREPLSLPEEAVLDLEPLALPMAGKSARAPADAPAVQLFLERASEARGGFRASDSDLPAIVEIVGQLDGIPLAIELAAARMDVLSAAQIRQRLSKRFELLAGGRPSRRAPARATLAGTLDWSWGLLSRAEQMALARCSVFRGGFDLSAAEAVLSGDVPDLLQALKRKSLLRAFEPDDFAGERRFDLWLTIRDYAALRLDEHGGRAEAEARHTQWFLQEAERLGRRPWRERVRRLALERDNLLEVHRRAVSGDAADASARALLALDPLLAARGPFASHLPLLDESLGLRAGTFVLRGKLLLARADARHTRGRAAEALADVEDALALARTPGESRLEAAALTRRGTVLAVMSRGAEARSDLERALAMHREARRPRWEGFTLARLGVALHEEGKAAEACEVYERAIGILADTGERWHEMISTHNLALALFDAGRLDDAARRYDTALAMAREIGDRRLEGVVRGNRATLLQERGAMDDARAEYERALELHREAGNRRFEATVCLARASLELERGRPESAASLGAHAADELAAIGDRRYEARARAVLAIARCALDSADAARAEIERAAAHLDARATEIHRAHLMLTETRRSASAAEAARLLVSQVDPAAPGDVRLARRLLAAALAR